MYCIDVFIDDTNLLVLRLFEADFIRLIGSKYMYMKLKKINLIETKVETVCRDHRLIYLSRQYTDYTRPVARGVPIVSGHPLMDIPCLYSI